MKFIKASKKLMTAIIAFVLSLVLCVGVCLAWYSASKKVGAGNPNVNLIEGDIVSFTVKAYYLDSVTGGYKKAENTGNVVGEGSLPTGAENVDANENGLLEDDDKMRPYGGLGNTFATAVLFEIEYELRTSDTFYRIFASCPASSELDVEKLDAEDDAEGSDESVIFRSWLSNAVGYYGTDVSGDIYSKSGDTADRFVQTDNSKINVVVLEKDIVPEEANNERGNYEGKVYVIMDYLPENFIYLSSLIIRDGGTLTSGLTLTGDLSINISVYDPNDPNDPDTPDVPEPDPDETVNVTGVTLNKNTLELTEEETETLRATVSPANATDKSVTWTTSDTAVATVSNGKVTAVGAGTATITVTTTDGEKTATCTVTVKEKQAEPPGPIGETNLFDGFTGRVSAGKILDNESLSVTLVGSVDVTSTSATASDGKSFDSYLLPSGGSRTYTIDAKKDITVKIYYTVRDGSGIKNDNVTATVDGEVLKTSSDGSRSDTVAYVMEISLTEGQSCVIASGGNRLVLYGIYIV